MNRQNLLVGGMIVLLCLLLWWKEQLFLNSTVKGQRLIRWFGPERAPWVLRGLIVSGIIFGLLLAAEIIRPIQW